MGINQVSPVIDDFMRNWNGNLPNDNSPVIDAFMRNWNDNLPNDNTRTALIVPLLPMLIETRSTDAVEVARGYMALDWAVRVCAPIALDAAGLKEHADTLRALPPIVEASDHVICCIRVAAIAAASLSFNESILDADTASAVDDCLSLVAFAYEVSAYAAVVAGVYAASALAYAAIIESAKIYSSVADLIERMCALGVA